MGTKLYSSLFIAYNTSLTSQIVVCIANNDSSFRDNIKLTLTLYITVLYLIILLNTRKVIIVTKVY